MPVNPRSKVRTWTSLSPGGALFLEADFGNQDAVSLA
jgi:hypothetical protein